MQGFILLTDLPISILAYLLALNDTELAASWTMVRGTFVVVFVEQCC
jgi:hypothetical protein